MTQICAPMTGSVVHVLAEVGQRVSSGQVLLVIEAMKMEHEIRADQDAEVAAVLVQLGDLVETDEVLIRLTFVVPVGAGDTPLNNLNSVEAASSKLRTDLQEVTPPDARAVPEPRRPGALPATNWISSCHRQICRQAKARRLWKPSAANAISCTG